MAGLPTVQAIFDPQYYQELDGGMLEGLGRLFSGRVKLFAYPTLSIATGELETADKLAIGPEWKYLYAHLLENGYVCPIQDINIDQLHISPGDVLKRIQSGDASWPDFVPPEAADLIKKKGLFGSAL